MLASGAHSVSPPLLEIRDVRIAASGSAPALRIDLAVSAGELHLVFSPDAARTTAITDALLGITAEAESNGEQGGARFRGHPWAELPPRAAHRLRGDIARVQSRGNWLDTRTVMENLLLPLRHHTVLPDDVVLEMASNLARRLGLPGLPTMLPHQCTASDLERAACIRAFLGRPSLVILEHPMELADVTLLPPLVDAIQEVRRRGGAVIWFTLRRAVFDDRSISADRRYRVTGTHLLDLGTA